MKTIQVIIETPKGSSEKYDYELSSGCFKLNKILPAGLVFPFDFGFIPGTRGGDGDPIDVLVISEVGTFTGCALECRVIGGIKASQRERNGDRMRNDRVIAIPVVSQQFGGVKKLTDLPVQVMDQLEHFFVGYNQQAGKQFTPLKRMGPVEAESMIDKGLDMDQKNNLIKLFIPLYDDEGNRFAEQKYKKINMQLTRDFGGMTMYTRTPASGLWDAPGQPVVKDELLVYEVLCSGVDLAYWQQIKIELERQFKQQKILIMTGPISVI